MKKYTVSEKVFCTPLKRYIPVSAEAYRSEVSGKLIFQNFPDSNNKSNYQLTMFEYQNPDILAWFDENISSGAPFFTYVEDLPEEVNGGSGSGGSQGVAGPQGPAGGPQGNNGTQGAAGSQGFTGTQGSTGTQGFRGFQGFQGTGTQGATGLQGNTGTQGTQGTTGTTGSTGTQGATGLQGFQGTTGATGTTGSAGATGLQGFQGNNGNQGATGAQGAVDAATAKVYEFDITYSGGSPSAVTNLPSGWSSSISTNDVEITHTAARTVKDARYFGNDGSNVMHYRLPSATNELTYATATETTKFIIRVSNSVVGTTSNGSAHVIVFF